MRRLRISHPNYLHLTIETKFELSTSRPIANKNLHKIRQLLFV